MIQSVLLKKRNFLSGPEIQKFVRNYTFADETKHSIQLTWTGENKKTVLMVTTEELFFAYAPSTIYRSDDDGAHFKDITSDLSNLLSGDKKLFIRKTNGLQRNPHKTSIIFVIAHSLQPLDRNSRLLRSHDSGHTWELHKLPFVLDGKLEFHPRKSRHDWILAQDHRDDSLYVSTDHGTNWKKIHDKVHKFSWGTGDQEKDTAVTVSYDKNKLSGLFKLFSRFRKPQRELWRTEDFNSGKWVKHFDQVYSFKATGNFIYVSTLLRDQRRRLKVSTDGCKKWNDVQLPTVTPDRFYSILDMSEGLVFMHVDSPGDTGFGTLYTSAADGIVFSKSLERHLFPNHMDRSDFYKVESLNGTYIATVMHEDNSMHTVITHDRGAEWKGMPKPLTGPCKDQTKGCFLQITNAYAQSRGVAAMGPLSIPNAPGVMLAHGHIAAALQTTPPDVYVTADGGYTWKHALSGPHHYALGDHGGLLFAVPASNSTPREIKFSVDEGNCWHTVKFTDKDIVLTGLLTEPGSSAMSAATWGFGNVLPHKPIWDKKWVVTVFDFEKIVPQHCTATDYYDWKPHSGACVMGHQLSVQKLKADSWCSNGHSLVQKNSKVACPCTEYDFECEYGYWRKVNGKDCFRNPNLKMLDVCIAGSEYLIKGSGYRKIPGNQCAGGWQPKLKEQKVYQHKTCDVAAAAGVAPNGAPVAAHAATPQVNRKTSVALAISGMLLALLILGGVLLLRQRTLRRRELRLKFSILNNADDAPIIPGAGAGGIDDSQDVGLLGSTTIQHTGGYSGLGGYTNAAAIPNGNRNVVPVAVPNARVDALKQQQVRNYHDDSDVDLID